MDAKTEMTYEEFKAAFTHAFREAMKYGHNEVGSRIWTDRMAELYDAHQEWAHQVMEEQDA